jgi:hypothetical protein
MKMAVSIASAAIMRENLLTVLAEIRAQCAEASHGKVRFKPFYQGSTSRPEHLLHWPFPQVLLP